MRSVDSRSKLSAWFSDTAKKQAFSRSAWLEMGGVETNNPTTAAYHFISSRGRKGEIPLGIKFAFSTKMFYDSQIPPGSTLCSYLEVPGRSHGVSEPFDEELLSLKGPTAPLDEPATNEEAVANNTLVHTEYLISETNSQTPNLVNDSFPSFSFPIPSASQPCEGEIQTGLLMSSSSESDKSQTPNSLYLASVLSPQPLECLYDIFSNTAHTEAMPAEYIAQLDADIAAKVNTTPRCKHPSAQEFFTPEITPLPEDTAVPPGSGSRGELSQREPTHSHPAVNGGTAVDDTLVHTVEPHISGTNSVTDSFPSFSFPIPSASQPCEREIQIRLLMSSSSESDKSQTPNSTNLVSVLSPQSLECIFDIFSNTAHTKMVPDEDIGDIMADLNSGVNTTPRSKHPSAQEYFTPEFAPLPERASHPIYPRSPSKDPMCSPPAVNTRFLPTVNSQFLPSDNTLPPTVNTQFPPAVNTQLSPAVTTQSPPTIFIISPPAVNTQFPPAVSTQSPPSITIISPPAVNTQFPPAVNTPSPPAVNTPSPPAVNTPSPPAVNTPSPPAVNTPSPPAVNTQFPPAVTTPSPPSITIISPPAVNTQFPPAVTAPSPPSITIISPPAVNTQFPPAVTTPSPPAVSTQFPPSITTTFPKKSSQHTATKQDMLVRAEDKYSVQGSPGSNSLHRLTFSPSSLLQSYHDITSGSNEKARSYFSEKELAFLRKYDQITF